MRFTQYKMERRRNHKEDPIPSFLALLAFSSVSPPPGKWSVYKNLQTSISISTIQRAREREREREAHTQELLRNFCPSLGLRKEKENRVSWKSHASYIDSILPFLDLLCKNALKRKQTLSVLVLF